MYSLGQMREWGYDMNVVGRICQVDGDTVIVPTSHPEWIAEIARVKAKRDKPKMRGLGDAIERVTKALHVPTCGGCGQRRDALNSLIPFKR